MQLDSTALTDLRVPAYAPPSFDPGMSTKMLVCPLCRVALDASETTCPRDGREGEEHAFAAIAAELSERFTVVAPFARGATGDLFLADDKQTGRRGILKILHNKSGVSTTERQRLKRELVKQATLSNSNIALPAVTGEASGSIWFFREWVDGVSLRVRLARGGRLATPEALSIAAQLAGALDELHRAGLLHRDLKPGHVLLQPQPSGLPKVVVIDAGVAARIDSEDAFDVAGSPRYISPEQATGKLVSFRSDLYSLGIVTYEMLEGRPPFEGDDVAALLRAHAEDPAPTAPADAPSGVQKLITQLLAKDPRERPFSAQQSRRVIEPFLPQGKGSREPTMAFDASAATATKPEATSSKGSGTLRPPQSKVTILGMPAAPHEPSKPPPPPADQPIRPSQVASRPPPPPGAPGGAKTDAKGKRDSSVPPPPPADALKKKTQNADSTQELDALDLEHVEAPVIEASPDGSSSAASATDTSSADKPAAAGSRDDLDYDDLAETTAMDRQEADERLGVPATLASGMPARSADEISEPGAQPTAAAAAAAENATTTPGTAAAASASSPGQVPAFGQGAAVAGAIPGTVPTMPQVAPDSAPYVAVPAKKKSKVPMIVGALLVGFCMLSSAVIGGAYWFVTSTVDGFATLSGEALDGPGAIAPAADPLPAFVAPETAPLAADPVQVPEAEAVETAPPVVEPEPVAEPEPEPEPEPTPEVEAADERSDRRSERGSEGTAREERAERPAAGGNDLDSLRAEAREHWSAGNFAGAAAAYERAARVAPRNAGVFMGLGSARYRMNEYPAAVAAYERAVELSPRNSGYLTSLGRALHRTGNTAGARQALQRALALDPNNRAARRGLEAMGQ